MRPFTLLVAAAPLLLTCCAVEPGAKPKVELGTTLASKFVRRGMTQVDNLVLQPRLAVGLPATAGGTWGIAADANMDLTNSTGDAWFPDGHAGRFSQIDLVADYSQRFDRVELRAGLQNYNLPNGLEFPFGERGSTSEAFVMLSANLLDATPYLSLHYDWDEVRDLYARAGLMESFELAEGLSLRLDGSLGHAGKRQAQWMYGIERAGLADLRGSAILSYAADPGTQLELGAHGSWMVDSKLNRWFDTLGIDAEVIWFSFGVTWRF